MKSHNRKPYLSTGLAILAAIGLIQAGSVAQSSPDPLPPGSQVRQTLAISYPEGPTIGVELAGTYRLPRARGEAKVERKKGMTEIEVKLDDMKPAQFFGGDFNTYVLWAISPEGLVDNLGEFILKGRRSKLNVTTTLETFGMMVTAEPHFLVEFPSRFVVLENSHPRKDMSPLKLSTLRYEGDAGVYEFENESLANMMDGEGEVRTHIDAARTAIDLAVRAGAEKYAADELASARQQLHIAEVTRARSPGLQMLAGHEAIRLAVEAEKRAKRRSFEDALAMDREADSERISNLEKAVDFARLEVAEREREVDRVREEQYRTQQRGGDGGTSTGFIEDRAADARSRLRSEMSSRVDVRQSDRGLVLTLPDSFFEFDRASLNPRGREAVNRLADILSVTKGFTLSVEGHTDNIGPSDFNQRFGVQRAESVRTYLILAGLSSDAVSAESFGESRPIAPNSTEAGRELNRRVEIIVHEDESFELLSSRWP